MPGLDEVVRVVDRALPFVAVSTDPSGSTTWVADVVAHAAVDPLAPWRRALEAVQGSQDKPHVAAAFVLQWFCDVVATPMAYAAELGPWVLVPSPAGLGFELAPGLYPSRIILRPGEVQIAEAPVNGSAESDREAALEASSAAYGQLVADVVRNFAPHVKMSSRQRWGLVDDMWAAAVRNAAGAAGRTVGPWRRVSCCFIVALPGMQACAGCPRLGPSPAGR